MYLPDPYTPTHSHLSITTASATAHPHQASNIPRPPTWLSDGATWTTPVAWGLAFYCVSSLLLLLTLYGHGVVDGKLNVCPVMKIRRGFADGLVQFVRRQNRPFRRQVHEDYPWARSRSFTDGQLREGQGRAVRSVLAATAGGTRGDSEATRMERALAAAGVL